jgi:hypothetical protein
MEEKNKEVITKVPVLSLEDLKKFAKTNKQFCKLIKKTLLIYKIKVVELTNKKINSFCKQCEKIKKEELKKYNKIHLKINLSRDDSDKDINYKLINEILNLLQNKIITLETKYLHISSEKGIYPETINSLENLKTIIFKNCNDYIIDSSIDYSDDDSDDSDYEDHLHIPNPNDVVNKGIQFEKPTKIVIKNPYDKHHYDVYKHNTSTYIQIDLDISKFLNVTEVHILITKNRLVFLNVVLPINLEKLTVFHFERESETFNTLTIHAPYNYEFKQFKTIVILNGRGFASNLPHNTLENIETFSAPLKTLRYFCRSTSNYEKLKKITVLEYEEKEEKKMLKQFKEKIPKHIKVTIINKK